MTAVLNQRDEKKAARAAAKTSKASTAANDWKGFIALELSDSQKTAAKVLRDDPERLFDNVFGAVDDLYKLSFSYDTYNGMYIASYTCKDAKSPNNGLTLSGRGGTLLGAMASLWYKHAVVLERVWGEAEQKRSRTSEEDDLG